MKTTLSCLASSQKRVYLYINNINHQAKQKPFYYHPIFACHTIKTSTYYFPRLPLLMKIKYHLIIYSTKKTLVMKNSNNTLHIFATVLVALFSIAFTTVAHATETSPVSVKFVGSVNSIPVFQLSFTNEKIEEYEITVTESNNIIYTEKIKGKKLVRKFQFVNNGSEEDVLQISIKNVSSKKVITYKINPATKVEVEKELVASL